MHILGIQFRQSAYAQEQEQTCIGRCIADAATVTYLSALDDTVSWADPEALVAGYDAVILGGSGDFDFDGGRALDDPARTVSDTFLQRLAPLLDHIMAHDVPTLGICYGHQLIGAWAGVPITCDTAQKKTGTYSVRCTEAGRADQLFGTLPQEIQAQYGHKDAMGTVPAGSTLLMEGGPQCCVPALRYTPHVYTVQFHPELAAADMIERLKNSPGYLPDGVQAEDLIRDDPAANALISSFVTEVVTKR